VDQYTSDSCLYPENFAFKVGVSVPLKCMLYARYSHRVVAATQEVHAMKRCKWSTWSVPEDEHKLAGHVACCMWLCHAG
jgi:hypothetical protein